LTRNIGSDLGHLLNNKKFSDVTFIVEGTPIFAHRALLFFRSEHFSAMLENGMKESSQDVIPLTNISHSVFLSVLEFMDPFFNVST
jgi:hypothetical protein